MAAIDGLLLYEVGLLFEVRRFRKALWPNFGGDDPVLQRANPDIRPVLP